MVMSLWNHTKLSSGRASYTSFYSISWVPCWFYMYFLEYKHHKRPQYHWSQILIDWSYRFCYISLSWDTVTQTILGSLFFLVSTISMLEAFISFLYVWREVLANATVHTWRPESENNVDGWFLSFRHEGLRNQTHVLGIGCKFSYLLNTSLEQQFSVSNCFQSSPVLFSANTKDNGAEIWFFSLAIILMSTVAFEQG